MKGELPVLGIIAIALIIIVLFAPYVMLKGEVDYKTSFCELYGYDDFSGYERKVGGVTKLRCCNWNYKLVNEDFVEDFDCKAIEFEPKEYYWINNLYEVELK